MSVISGQHTVTDNNMNMIFLKMDLFVVGKNVKEVKQNLSIMVLVIKRHKDLTQWFSKYFVQCNPRVVLAGLLDRWVGLL